MSLLSLISLVFLSTAISLRIPGARKFSGAIALSFVAIVLYLFALLDILQIGVIFIVIFGFLLGIVEIWRLKINSGKDFLVRFEYKSLALIVAIALMWFLFTRRAVIHNTDEFYWASYAKFLFHNHGFSGPWGNIKSFGLTYLPGSPLLANFFLLTNNFSAPDLYFGQGMISLILIWPLFGSSNQSLKHKFIFAILLLWLISYFLFNYFGFISLLTDTPIGIGLALAAYLSIFELKTWRQKLYLLPILAMLSLLKENAVFFCLLIALLNIWDLRKQINMKTIFVILALILIPIATYSSWRLVLKNYQLSSNVSFEQINLRKKALKDSDLELQSSSILVAEKFAKAVTSRPISYTFDKSVPFLKDFRHLNIIEAIDFKGLSAFAWLGLCLVYCTWVATKSSLRREGALAVLFCLGFVVYWLVLLGAYIFIYPKNDALSLTSFERYLGSYAMAMILVTLCLAFRSVDRKSSLRWLTIPILLVAIIQTPPLYNLITYPKTDIAKALRLQKNSRPIIDAINSLDTNKKIFLDTELEDGQGPLINYEVMPRKISNVFALDEQTNQWRPDYNPPDLPSNLKSGNYNCIIFGVIADERKSEIERTLKIQIKNPSVYKIDEDRLSAI